MVPIDGIPMTFGPSNVIAGSGEPPTVNLVYEGVGLCLNDGSAWLWVTDEHGNGADTFRSMWQVQSVEFDHYGTMRLLGAEETPEGYLVPAVWEAQALAATLEEAVDAAMIDEALGRKDDSED